MGFLKSLWKKFEKKRRGLQRVSSLIRQVKEKRKSFELDYRHIHVDDLPDEFKNSTIYVVGENGYDWLVAFKCPCGCNDVVQLNLLSDGEEVWKVIYHNNGTLSLSPSINRVRKCKSHFSINKNLVWWWKSEDNNSSF